MSKLRELISKVEEGYNHFPVTSFLYNEGYHFESLEELDTSYNGKLSEMIEDVSNLAILNVDKYIEFPFIASRKVDLLCQASYLEQVCDIYGLENPFTRKDEFNIDWTLYSSGWISLGGKGNCKGTLAHILDRVYFYSMIYEIYNKGYEVLNGQTDESKTIDINDLDISLAVD